MTDPSIPLPLQHGSFSPPVMTRLAQLPNRVISQWTVTVHSLPGQALVLQEDGIAIVCDNLTYRATEHDAFSRITFTEDTNVSFRLPLKTVEVVFNNAAEMQQFRAAVAARTATVPAATQDYGIPLLRSEASTGSTAPPKMTGAHKFSRSSVQITTSLSADRVAEISQQVGESTKGNVRIGMNHVRFEGASEGRTNFSIRALGDLMEFMTFHVAIADADGGTRASSHIDSFKTKQEKLFMLIPLGPKNMIAYKTYRLFMENMKAAITAADNKSRIVLTEKAVV